MNQDQNKEIWIIGLCLSIILILFIPIPSQLLDVLLILNISWTCLLLIITFYTDKPLSFSTFPSLLLISTLLRLGLNVSATRLILSSGDPGHVIHAVGDFVIKGNYAMGLVVFFVLIIVQYVVVTSGAQRVAEVAARFTLDSMPGKQMSIDADLNMGLIDADAAAKRRTSIEREANFYGAMDGASKFVKGDAIAGILILIIDIIGGLIIGITQHGMSIIESLHHYALLTIGDGIVTQIPALIIAFSTGIIVTRAATDAKLSEEISAQLGAEPKALFLIVFFLFLALFIKGIPALVILPLLLFFGAWWLKSKSQYNKNKAEPNNKSSKKSEKDKTNLSQYLHNYPLSLVCGEKVFAMMEANQTYWRDEFEKIKARIAKEQGFLIDSIKINKDSSLEPFQCEFKIKGQVEVKFLIYPDRVLIINPQTKIGLDAIKVKDPLLGMESYWLPCQEGENYRDNSTLIEPLELIKVVVDSQLKEKLSELLTIDAVDEKLATCFDSKLKDILIPNKMDVSQLHTIFQSLLAENCSIKQTEIILGVLIKYPELINSTELIVEKIREQLKSSICNLLANKNGQLPVITLSALLEREYSNYLNVAADSSQLNLPHSTLEALFKKLANCLEQMVKDNIKPVLLCSPPLRYQLKQLTQRLFPTLSVLSLSEIASDVELVSYQVIEAELNEH